jgi:hypothetical protein
MNNKSFYLSAFASYFFISAVITTEKHHGTKDKSQVIPAAVIILSIQRNDNICNLVNTNLISGPIYENGHKNNKICMLTDNTSKLLKIN